jgi:hypothetical protein
MIALLRRERRSALESWGPLSKPGLAPICIAAALGASAEVEIPEAARAGATAYVITAAEGATLHLDPLRRHAADFDPAVRDRLIAWGNAAGAACRQGSEISPLVP